VSKPGTVVYRRPRAPLSKKSLETGYGRPLVCSKCSQTDSTFYGKLKLPGEKDTPCPNCGTRLSRPQVRRR
jgi:hypothetical protein